MATYEQPRQQIDRRVREIRSASGGRISQEDARALATAEASAGPGGGLLRETQVRKPDDRFAMEDPTGQSMESMMLSAVQPPANIAEAGIAPPVMPEVESSAIETDLRRGDEPVPETVRQLTKEEEELNRGVDTTVEPEHGGEPEMPSEQEMEYYTGKASSEALEEGRKGFMGMEEEEERIAGEMAVDGARFDEKFDAHTETQKEFNERTTEIIEEDDAASEERLANPNSAGYENPKDQMDADEAQRRIDNLDSGRRDGGPISPEDSPWVQKYHAEEAIRDAAMNVEMDKRTKGTMNDEMADTQRRLNKENEDKNRALIDAGHEPGNDSIPVTETTEGTVGGGLYDKSLKDRIEVKDENGNITRVIFRDKPGAREQQGRDKESSGKVRMRQAKGGYARAADDEPYSEQDQYISESQAGRAESTAGKRISKKERRKGLLARNRKIDKGWRNPENPFAYGDEAASVRIAQIAADAVKAKAEAEAKIDSDNTLNDHQKDLALLEAKGEIDAKAAASKAEVDKAEGDANRRSSERKGDREDAAEAKQDALVDGRLKLADLKNAHLALLAKKNGEPSQDKQRKIQDQIDLIEQEILDIETNIDELEAGGEPTTEELTDVMAEESTAEVGEETTTTEGTPELNTDDTIPLDEANAQLQEMGMLSPVQDALDFDATGVGMIAAARNVIALIRGSRKLGSADGLIALGSKLNLGMPRYGNVMLSTPPESIDPVVWKMVTEFFNSLMTGNGEMPPNIAEIEALQNRSQYMAPGFNPAPNNTAGMGTGGYGGGQ